eukprot:295733-Rhodomonas_salina.1
MSGTEVGYRPSSSGVLMYRMLLRACDPVSGTALGYRPSNCGVLIYHMLLRTCYAMSGTEAEQLCSTNMPYPATRVLRVCGTEVGYGLSSCGRRWRTTTGRLAPSTARAWTLLPSNASALSRLRSVWLDKIDRIKDHAGLIQ